MTLLGFQVQDLVLFILIPLLNSFHFHRWSSQPSLQLSEKKHLDIDARFFFFFIFGKDARFLYACSIIGLFRCSKHPDTLCNDQLNNYGILMTSYWWEIVRGDCFETGRLSDQSSRLTVPWPQWTRHLNTSVTLNRLTSAKPRHLSMSLHSPEMNYNKNLINYFAQTHQMIDSRSEDWHENYIPIRT